jgi:predicted permease
MNLLEQIARDFRHGIRALLKMPVLSTVVILSLGVGIGVNTVVFSWIEAVVMRPMPGVEQAGSFYSIEPRNEAGSFPGTSWPEYRDLQTRLTSFSDLLAYTSPPFNVGEAPRTTRSFGQLVSGNFFSVLGLRPALGRFIRIDEAERAGGAPVVVISHEYWQIRYSGDRNIINQTLRVNQQELTIIGVAPEGFQGSVLGLNFDLWVPLTMSPVLLPGSRLEDRTVRGLAVMGRLEDDATLAQAQTELEAGMRDLALQYPDTNRGLAGEIRPFWRSPRGPQEMMAQGLFLLQGVMLLLLLAVCGNTANLVLARITGRHREIGTRLALGAGPVRIIALLLSENLILGMLGAVLGALIAVWGTDALRAAPMIGAFPIKFQTSVHGTGLMFAMALGVISGMLFGVVPSAQLARIDPLQALRAGARTLAPHRLRNGLMAIQVALALLVLVVAALFYDNFREGRGEDPGFRRDGLLLAAYDLTGRGLDEQGFRDFAARLLAKIRELPSVEGVAIAQAVPLDLHGLPARGFTIEGRARTDGGVDRALSNIVSPGYFAAMGIQLLAGADFADLTDQTAPLQAIVNDEFVRRYLDGVEPLGRRLQAGGRTYVIAGVVQTTRYESYSEAPTPFVYYSYRDRPSRAGEIHLHTRTGSEASVAADVQRIVRELDPTLPVYDVRTMGEHVEKNLFLRRIPARMFAVLGPMLLVLAAIGIYAVVAYVVAHRTSEIGVRLALGATPPRVVRQIVLESLRVVVAGAVGGWLLAYGAYIHLVPGRPFNSTAFVLVPTILMMVALVSSWIPAARATGVNPMVALREE